MNLAFNVSAGRQAKHMLASAALLIAGNLSLVSSWHALLPPDRDAARIEGPRNLVISEPRGDIVDVSFDRASWFTPESSLLDYWRWCRGPAKITFHNPHPFAVRANVTFNTKGLDTRTLTIRASDGHSLWQGEVAPVLRPGEVDSVQLPPGDTTWEFDTDKPPTLRPGNRRKVAFSLRSLKLVLLRPD
jgi:hypothetical protein